MEAPRVFYDGNFVEPLSGCSGNLLKGSCQSHGINRRKSIIATAMMGNVDSYNKIGAFEIKTANHKTYSIDTLPDCPLTEEGLPDPATIGWAVAQLLGRVDFDLLLKVDSVFLR